ncbi:DUF2934 domain-containing protein [Paraburkholderia sp. RL17-373-BIF-A]|uniref:DUF2934 domain-containing protein n=1 Tax=Paraburkholderia sp. RL17-373-BIF-A TaxID=3031629 RepID=UPI0038BD4F32
MGAGRAARRTRRGILASRAGAASAGAAHVLWVQDGRPEGRADEYWIRDFEAQ